MTKLLIANPYALQPILAVASISTVLNAVAGFIAAIGVVGVAAALIFCAIPVMTGRGLEGIKYGIIGAGVAALAFPLAIWLFTQAGMTVNLQPTAIQ
jgi:hypothetical protein